MILETKKGAIQSTSSTQLKGSLASPNQQDPSSRICLGMYTIEMAKLKF